MIFIFITYRNIFRKPNETIKLGDFGISVTCFDGTVHKFSDFGSTFYNAPEVLRRRSFNAKCDVW
jgi:serine/threonine protein kinase